MIYIYLTNLQIIISNYNAYVQPNLAPRISQQIWLRKLSYHNGYTIHFIWLSFAQISFNPKRYGLFRWSKVWGGEESNHTCFWAPTWPSHVQMTHRWSQMKADTLIHLTFWNITLFSSNNCWIRFGWKPHPLIHLTHFFCRISKFSQIFIHNPNFWSSLHFLNILKC